MSSGRPRGRSSSGGGHVHGPFQARSGRKSLEARVWRPTPDPDLTKSVTPPGPAASPRGVAVLRTFAQTVLRKAIAEAPEGETEKLGGSRLHPVGPPERRKQI